MTAPVIDIADVMNEAVAAALPAAPEAVAPDEGAETLDDTAADDSEADAAPEDAPEETAAPAEGEAEDAPAEEEAPVELPDGLVAVPTVTDGLATEFILRDEHGEIEVPALIVEYKANGKVRQDRLDQVVKLAQWGVYNHERQQQVEAEVEQQIAQYQQLLEQREAQMERMLTDEEFRERVYESYLTETSPERRAERAEQAVENLRVQQQLESITSSGDQFYNQEVVPAIRMIVNALPTISSDELESKLEMALQAHAELAPNGVPYVSPSRYDAIRKYILEDLALWAQAAHARRVQPAQAAKANAELERAQVEAQKAKRMVGQKLKPVGSAGASPDRPKAAPKTSTVDDAVDSALQSVLSSMRN
jgi:hypothetical protein